MKNPQKITLALLLLTLLCRGPIYRHLITYHPTAIRPEIPITNQALMDQIDEQAGQREMNMAQIICIANGITGKVLQFTTDRALSNPNELLRTRRANCIGYAALFNAIANYLIRKNHLQDQIAARHQVGRLTLAGTDLHQFFDDPFFRDHDFNTLTDLASGAVIAVDPTVSDYLWIERVTSD